MHVIFYTVIDISLVKILYFSKKPLLPLNSVVVNKLNLRKGFFP